MAATTRYTGSNLYVSFAGTALTTDGRNFEVTLEQETVDATAGADSFRVMIPTVKNVSASMEIIMAGTDGTAVLQALKLNAQGTLLWGPEGTAAGKPKFGFLARVVNASQSLPYDDVAKLSVEWQNYGSALLFDGTNGAVWP